MIDTVAAELRSIAKSSTNATGYFAALYSQVTQNVAAAIRQGSFTDGARMERFATVFASYYIDAMHGDGRRPRSWQACLDVADDNALLIVQHLLLGINAHINHDLPFAVAEVTGDGNIEDVRGDFEAINRILAETYGGILKALERVSRWIGEADLLGGGRLFNFSLERARDQAWAAAERLVVLDVAGRDRYEKDLDEQVSVLAYLVTKPPALLRPLLRLARSMETQDAKSVTSVLLAPD
ncbi:MAG: hypothetical protein QOJ19_451 [Acidimicrobiia bacterium]|jgi:hypothetical protein|nr:hypothetical protein [Acidimicrobiia bacterium]